MEYLWNAPGAFGGDKGKARETARRIGQIDPVRGYLAEARLAARDKDTSGRAEALYRKAVDEHPRSYLAQMTAANFYASGAGPRLDLAEQHVREALAIAPDRAGPYGLLARVYASQQRLGDLDAVLAEAERRVPDNPSPFLSAANALFRAGLDLPRAERYIRTYLSQEPEGGATSRGVAHWRLGLVLERQGRVKDAIAELEAATRLEPTRQEIARDLERLKKRR
jgi:tetratricopeptide (TPR) repeat protein